MFEIGKKVIVKLTVTDDIRARWCLRMRYDGFTNTRQWFLAIVQAYIDNDPDILNFIQRYQHENKFLNKQKLAKNRRLIEEGEDWKKYWNIDVKEGEEDTFIDDVHGIWDWEETYIEDESEEWDDEEEM